MVGVLPADGPDARAARRRGRPDRPARAGRAARRVDAKGKQTWRYRFPAQDFDLGRGDGLRPGQQAGATRRQARSTGASATVVAIDPAALHRRPQARPSTSRIPRAVVPLDWSGRRTSRRALLELGEWVAEHGIDATGPAPRGPRPAARPAAAGRPGGSATPLRRPGETDLEAARRLALALDRHDPRRSRARPAPARPTPARG